MTQKGLWGHQTSQSSPVILAQLFQDTMIGMKKIANSTQACSFIKVC